jgi:methyl-accepting chemotaxis protein
MSKYKYVISIVGCILQVFLVYLFVRRLGYWNAVGFYFVIFSLLLLLYNMFIDKKPTLRRYCIVYVGAITIMVLVSGIFAGFESVALAWLLLAGIVSGILVATLVYHIIHIFIPGGLEEQGLPHYFEVSLTFFSLTAYPMLYAIPFTFANAVVLALVIFGISLLVGFALTLPLVRSTGVVAGALESWQEIDKLPTLRVTIINRITGIIDRLLARVKNTFGTLSEMSNQIRTSSEDVSSVSEQMNASLEEVSSTVQQISKGAQEQSASITAVAKSIEELNNLTSSISSQVKMASVSSRKTTDSAKQGMELSKKEASISREIFEQTTFIEEKMNELRDQAGEIKKILDIIAGVTDQTDLLALNAAIEAARVGEQGKGFAVVADEIRTLATETQQSSAVVENLISEITKTVLELSSLLSSERQKMTESNELAAQTEEQFTGIVKAVDLVTDMVARISQAATDQAENTTELVQQIEQIAQVANETASATQEVSASVEEQTASMQELTSTAQVLSSFAAKLEELLAQLRK